MRVIIIHMSGHSRWSQIKRKKGIKDVQKGKIFTKISRLITLSVKESGGIIDPLKNIKLRLAIQKAKESNMPKENITKAIEKATSNESNSLKEVVYEAFGPDGVSLIIQATTDNQNRTFAEIRTMLEKHNGKMGVPGSTMFNFDRCGIVVYSKTEKTEEEIFDMFDKHNGKDLETDSDNYYLYLPFEQIGLVENAELIYRPTATIEIASKEAFDKLINLIEVLEEMEDVVKVFSNFEAVDSFYENI